MNRNRLKNLLILAAALVLSACGGAGDNSGDNSAGATATSGVNAASPGSAAASGANVAPANSPAAAAPTPPSTGDGAVQPGVAPKGGARGSSNAQQASMPKPQIGSGGNDFYLFTQARGALNADTDLKAANISVDVKEGVVTLSGAVASAEQKLKAEQLVRAVGGVKAIRNQLRASGSD